MSEHLNQEEKLREVLNNYPNIQVIERSKIDSYTIVEFEEDNKTEKSITYLTVVYDKKGIGNDRIFPCLIYKQEENTTFLKLKSEEIEVFEVTDKVKRIDYIDAMDEVDEILDVVYGGLKIMEVYKEINPETIYKMERTYWNRVGSSRTENDQQKMIHNCFDRALRRIEEYRGEEE